MWQLPQRTRPWSECGQSLSFLKRRVLVLCGQGEARGWQRFPSAGCVRVLRGPSHAGPCTPSGFSLRGSMFLANTLGGCEAGPLLPMFGEVWGSKLSQPQTKEGSEVPEAGWGPMW